MSFSSTRTVSGSRRSAMETPMSTTETMAIRAATFSTAPEATSMMRTASGASPTPLQNSAASTLGCALR
jgi:hypothetical protein